MKVKELIAILQKIEDKELLLLIDCPHCGKSQELKSLRECAVLGGVPIPGQPKPAPKHGT